MYPQEPAPEPCDELKWADHQCEHAAEHVHAEHELAAHVHLALLRKVAVWVEREVASDERNSRQREQSHDHPARLG